MRNNSLPPHFLNALLFDQAQHSVKGAAHFERADALEVLALEKQAYLRLRRFLPLPLRSLQRFRRLRRRCEIRQRRVCQDWCSVDVRLDKFMSSFHRLPIQRSGGSIGRHVVLSRFRDMVGLRELICGGCRGNVGMSQV
jgi:hypothetical protein